MVLDEPFGDIEIHGGWLHIGSVIDPEDGTVHAVPRYGIGGDATARLLAVAESVAISGRPQSPAWKYHPNLGWVAGVRVRLPHHTEATAAEEFEEARG